MTHLSVVREEMTGGGGTMPAADEQNGATVVADLADAAGQALDEAGEELQMSPEQGGQEALIPACKVKFQGMSYDSIDEVPDLKQEMTFLVRGRVVSHEQLVRKDGEIRDVAKVEVDSVQLYTGS